MPRNAKTAAFAALASVGCLGLTAALAYWVDPIQRADATALRRMSELGDGPAGSLATALTFFVEPVCLLILLAVLCVYGLRRGRSAEVVAAVAVVAGANVTTQILKFVLAHPRFQPVLVNQPDLDTFPSGHVTGAISLVVAAVWVARPDRRRLVACVGAGYAAAVGLSVLVLEWHLPSDVVGAFFVTAAWGFGVLAAYLHMGLRPRLPIRRRGPSRSDHAAAVTVD